MSNSAELEQTTTNNDASGEPGTDICHVEVTGITRVHDDGSRSSKPSRKSRASAFIDGQRVGPYIHNAVIRIGVALTSLEATDRFVSEQLERALTIGGEGDDGGIADGVFTEDLERAILNLRDSSVAIVAGKQQGSSTGFGKGVIGANAGPNLERLRTVLGDDDLSSPGGQGATLDRWSSSDVVGDKDTTASNV